MLTHKHYTISDEAIFDIADYPELTGELLAINERFSATLRSAQTDIIVSYLKDHSIRKTWVNEHREFVESFISFSSRAASIEALFAASRQQRSFSDDLAKYIRQKITFAPAARDIPVPQHP